MKPVDVVAIGAHPDDVELWAGGTICSLTARGHRVTIIDLTEGELGSRGTVETRREEAANAAEILGVTERANLCLPDGDIRDTAENRLRLIKLLRGFAPKVVLVGAPECRHPDHTAATALSISAIYFAGLRRIETTGVDGAGQLPHRPDHVLHYMQAIPFTPTFSVDVSEYWDQRLRAMRAFRTQFFHPDNEPGSGEPETYVSNPAFFEWMEARAKSFGYPVGAKFAEPFLYRNGPVGVDDLMTVLSKARDFK